MAKAAYLTVRESFIAALDGDEVEYHKGEVVDSDDPAVARFPAHFEPLKVRAHARSRIEQATAGPGERRAA